MLKPDTTPSPESFCQSIKADGNLCRRRTSKGDRVCWQHARWFRPKLRSLAHRPVFVVFGVGVLFVLAVAIAQTLIGHYWPPTQIQLAPVKGSQGEPLQKAPQSEFDREADRSADNLKKIAAGYFHAAENDFANQDYEQAAENYAKSISAIPTMSAYLNEGLVFLNLSDRPRAEDALLNGLKIARDERNKALEAAFLNPLGLVYLHEGDMKEALNTFGDSLAAAKLAKSIPGQADALVNIGEVYERQGKYDDAINVLQEASQMSTDSRLMYVHSKALMLLGESYLGRGSAVDLGTARQIIQEQACPLVQQLQDSLGEAQCLDNKGAISMREGKDEDALQFLKLARAIYIEKGSTDGQATSLINICVVLGSQGKYTDALKACSEALELSQKTCEVQRQAKALFGMGLAYLQMHNYDEAHKKFQLALSLSERVGDSAMEKAILSFLGDIRRDESVSRNGPHAR